MIRTIKLLELVKELEGKGVKKFFLHHPQLIATLDVNQMLDFASKHADQTVKVLHQDLDLDLGITYLYLGIDDEDNSNRRNEVRRLYLDKEV